MKKRTKIIAFSLLTGIAFWLADSILDYYFFNGGNKNTFDILTAHTSAEEYIMRIIMILLFVIAGIVISRYVLKRDEAVRKLLIQKEELHRRREDLHTTLNSIGDCVIVTDKKGMIVRMNPAAENLTGYKFNEIAGEPLNKIVKIKNADTGNFIENPVGNVINTGEAIGLSNHSVLISKDNKEYQIADSAAPVKDAENNITGVVFVFKNLTESYKIRKELKESEERFRTLINTSPDIIAIYQDGKFVFINSPGIKILGADNADQIVGISIEEIIHPDFIDITLERINKVLSGEKNLYPAENKFIRSDGTELPVEIFAIAIEYLGKPAVQIIARDITDRKKTEERLRLNQFGIENSRISIFQIDEEGQIYYVNKYACETLGYTYEELTGMSIAELDLNFDLEGWKEHRKGVREAGSAHFETFHKKKDGTVFPVEITVNYINFENTRVSFSFATDISERKKAEEALKESEERVRLALEGTRAGSWDWNIKTGKLHINERWAEMIGYKLKELQPANINTWMMHSHPDDVKISTEAINEHFEGKKDYYECDIRMKHKNGNWIWVRDRGKVIEWDEDGTPLRMAGTHVDITGQKETELALKESEENLRTTLDSIGDAVITTDTKGNITGLNPIAVKLTGFTSEAAKGKPLIEVFNIVNSKTRKQAENPVDKVLTTGKIIGLANHTSLISKDGKEYPIADSGAPILNENGGITGVVLVFRDVTESYRMQEELKESEERFRNLVDSSPDTIIICQHQNIVFINDAGIKLLNTGKDKLVGMPLKNIIHPGKRETSLNNIQKISRSNEILTPLEDRFIRPDGTLLPVELVAVPIQYKGKPAVQLILRDISERKKSEKQLRLISYGIDHSEMGIYRIDENGKIRYANEFACKSLGYGYDELCSKYIWDIDINLDSDFWQEHRRHTRSIGTHTVETYHKRKDGTIFPAEVTINFLEFEDENISFSFAKDITERKNAESQLQLQSTALNSAANAIVVTGDKGYIRWVNSAFAKLTGYKLQECLGRNLLDFLESGENEKIKEQIWDTISSGNIWQGQVISRKKNGGLYFEEQTITPVYNKEKITNFIAIKQDVTKRKAMEDDLIEAKNKAEASNKIKSEFLAQMSHEIRTPLNVIINSVNFIKELTAESLDKEYEDLFANAEASSKRIINTIDRILNLSEVQTGTFEPFYKKIDLNVDVLAGIFLEFKTLANTRGLELIYNCSVQNSELLLDEYSTTQIFANLVDNAIKYTKAGSVEISLFENEYGNKTVQIKDTGIGIGEEFIPLLFEPFRQEEQGYSRRFEGTGLGLSLVKNYCNYNNATIDVTSKKNTGTTFTVTFKNR